MNMVSNTNPMLTAALGYARKGWFVFPLQVGTKGSDADGRSSHLLDHGHNDASNDIDRIRAWWTRWPDANIGLNLAASGLVAIDIDAYKPECGWDDFVRDRVVPDTLTQRSARGGRHLVFKAESDAQYTGRICPGVDVKHRGYILLGPSTFDGASYVWETDCVPAPAPEWLRTPPPAARIPATPLIDFGSVDHEVSTGEVRELLDFIDPDAGGYDAWIEVLQGLHDHYGASAEGLAIADAWSRKGAKYRPGEVEAKWNGFKAGGGVTLKTVAMQAGRNGADLSGIARRYRTGAAGAGNHRVTDEQPDLSHDHLALDLGARSWDANARHVALWGKWLFWTGSHWQCDDKLEHLSRIRAYLRERAQGVICWAERKAVGLENGKDTKDAEKVRTWARDQARALRSNASVTSVSNLVRANPASASTHEAFDTDHYLLGTPGGTVDLRTGRLRPARREDMISRLTSCSPAPPGSRPTLWLKFLTDVFDGEAETIAFLQRAAGYALTGCTDEHKLLFLHGSGRNGKSVFLNTLLDIWGAYGRRVAATTFLHSQTERHPTDIAGLQGARLAIASELPRGKTWDEATIKDLTGGDRLTARYMRQDFFEFTPQLTLMIAGNTQPSFRGVDEAIRSRVVLVPFSVTIPANKRDRGLGNKLLAEGPEILRWCIDGALDWQERGLDVPSAIAAASRAYFDEEDTIGQFLEDETVPDLHAIALTDDLIEKFNFWSDRQGLGRWTKRTLVKELKLRGFLDAKSNGRRGLRGLRLR